MGNRLFFRERHRLPANFTEMGFWRGLCCIPRRKRANSDCIETTTIIERLPEENDFDQVVPETFDESSDAKAAISKKSQFEDLLNSKQNDLGLEVIFLYFFIL